MMHPITNTEPVDNEFFLQDGAIYSLAYMKTAC